jgi:hypothetical protein
MPAHMLKTVMSIEAVEFRIFDFRAPLADDEEDVDMSQEAEVDLVVGLKELRSIITFCEQTSADELSLRFTHQGYVHAMPGGVYRTRL